MKYLLLIMVLALSNCINQIEEELQIKEEISVFSGKYKSGTDEHSFSEDKYRIRRYEEGCIKEEETADYTVADSMIFIRNTVIKYGTDNCKLEQTGPTFRLGTRVIYFSILDSTGLILSDGEIEIKLTR
tara:strand:- start:233 stop:619 length:387 start_codon:yes stop_codon:yes gene_type:complete